MSTNWTFTNNSAAVIAALNSQKVPALEEIGLRCVAYAKANITAAGRVNTGQYRNSITHRVKPDENAVYIGSNLEHAIYNEVGTGRYAEGGVRGYWVYVTGQDEATRAAHRRTSRKRYTLEQAKKIVAMMNAKFKKEGKPYKAYYTEGMKPTHALQKAASEHNATYKKVMKKWLKF